jgi:hypothetical protein
VRTAVELTIRHAPDAVPKARRFVASSLIGEADETVADVELLVSELVTNAVLHGRPPVAVRLVLDEGRVRIEVEDTGPDLPVLGRPGSTSMTGRGLALVAALSSAWGMDPGRRQGKVVWAELSDSPSGGPPRISDGFLAASHWDRLGVPTYAVRLDGIPTSLLVAVKAHIDSVTRELTLWRNGGEPVPDELLSLVAVTGEFAEAREEIKRQAVAAAAEGRPITDLLLRLPASMADAGERYLAALDEADRFARAARLLTLAPPLSHRTLRVWYVSSLVTQLRDLDAGRRPEPPEPLAAVLASRLDELQSSLERAETA